MPTVTELIEDGELLALYAISRNVSLSPGTTEQLLSARTNQAVISNPGPQQDAFRAAMQSAATSVGATAGDIRAQAARSERLRPLAFNALRLLTFSAETGRKVEDSVRNSVIDLAATIDAKTAGVGEEQEFLKAYESLTVALSPITVDTLDASALRLPSWETLKTQRGREVFLAWVGGRALNIGFFAAVLLLACVALGFYYQGASSLSRYKELQDAKATLEKEFRVKLAAYRGSLSASMVETGKPAEPDVNMGDVVVFLDDARVKVLGINNELIAIPERLSKWAESSCLDESFFVTRWALCSEADSQVIRARMSRKVSAATGGTATQPAANVNSTPQASRSTGVKESDSFNSSAESVLTPEQNAVLQLEHARTVASRLSDVYLPLLLGWLGAHAFVLRRLSKDITARTVAKGSAFNHLVRVGLGALAGVASTWLLTPDAVSNLLPAQDATLSAQFRKLPVWGLAFVAGYGIELVFAFMDRIISAFTPNSGNAAGV